MKEEGITVNYSRRVIFLIIVLLLIAIPILVSANNVVYSYIPMVFNRYPLGTKPYSPSSTPTVIPPFTATATNSIIPIETSTPTPTNTPTPTLTETTDSSVTFFVCGLTFTPPDTWLGELSLESCGTGNLLAGLTTIDWEATLTGDIDGTAYEFALEMATQYGIEPASPSIDVFIILDQGGQETVLASTNFIVDNDGGGGPTYDTQLYTASVTGIDPVSSSGDRLIFRAINNGLGTMILKYGSEYSSIKIPPIK